MSANLQIVQPTEACSGLQETTAATLRFPHEALKGSLGELATVLSRGNEIAPELAFGAALTCLGSMVSGAVNINLVGYDTRLFTVLLGASFSAKKSTAAKTVIEFFKSLTCGYPVRTCNGVGSAEGLAKAFGETKPDGRLLLNYDELEAFFRKAGIEGSVLLQTVTSLFESREFESHTKTHTIKLENVRLGFLACCTLQTYEHCWSSEALSIGLDNRLFLVNADAKPSVAWPEQPSEAEKERLRKKIQMQLAKLPVHYDITVEARHRFSEWYDRLMERNTPFVKRISTIAWRLMGLLTLTQDKDAIDLEVIDQVIALCDHQVRLRELSAPSDIVDKFARMEAAILKNLRIRGPLTERDLRRYTNADREGRFVFSRSLENLQKSDEIKLQAIRPKAWMVKE